MGYGYFLVVFRRVCLLVFTTCRPEYWASKADYEEKGAKVMAKMFR